MRTVTTTITPAEIREAWDKIQEGKRAMSSRQAALSSHANEWRGSAPLPWQGLPGGGREMQRYLHDGYWPESVDMPNLSGADVSIDSPVVEWHEEEGELVYEAMLGNEDLMFVQWDQQPQPRGMKIRACFDFNAGTHAETMGAYFDWVLAIIDRAESLGIAPDVELFIDTQGSFREDHERRDVVTIPVVKAGEVIDVVAWRAYLHRGGFRTLGFLALGLVGDKLALSLTSSLGSAVGRKWDVEFADDTLTVHVPGNPTNFPRDEMTRKVDAIFSQLG